MMHGDPHSYLSRLGDNLVRFYEIDTQRFFDVDVYSVFEHPHRQVVMKLCARWNGDEVWLGLADHRIEILIARVDAELITQLVATLRNQITQPDHFGARMRPISSRRCATTAPTSENCHSVRFHLSPLPGFASELIQELKRLVILLAIKILVEHAIKRRL